MSAPALRVVDDVPEGLVEGQQWPLIPDGEYLATYIDHQVVELRQFANAPRVFVHFKLYDAGEHTAKILYRAYRVSRRIDGRRFAVARKSDLLRMLARVMNLPAGRRLDRISLRDLKPMLLRVKTRTVKADPKKRELPAALHYSVIDDVIGNGA